MRIFESEIILYGVIFFAVVLLAEATSYLVAYARQGRTRINRRLRMLDAGRDPDKVYNILRPQLPAWARQDSWSAELYLWLDKQLLGAGIGVRPDRFLVTLGLLTAGALVIGLPIAHRPSLHLGALALPAGVVTGVLVGAVFPIMFIREKRARRLKKFSEQLPSALDVMVRALRAGHPAAAAVDLVSTELPDPIGTEFGLLSDEITYGLDFKDALDNMARRLDLQDVRYFAVCVTIQSDTGGNLAEILSNLASVVRARFSLARKVIALSSEARISALLLSVLPVLTILFILWKQPRFYLMAVDDPIFWPSVGYLLAMYVFGIWVIRRMIKIRV